MPNLVLGPLLRHIGAHDATVWVETDAACEVEVLGHRTRTFEVEGHHYGLVVVEGLEPGRTHEYEVTLDDVRAWPPEGSSFPPSVIRTIGDDHGLRLLFGSCRVSLPHEPPYTLMPEEDERGRGLDSLRAYALRMHGQPPEEWPRAMFFVGDQVYADEVSPQTLEFIRSRRDTSVPPGEEVADFEEYTRLYLESWSDPVIRWFLSTVSSTMLFDDHDVHDDWNISDDWVARMREQPWWDERITGAFMSYWLYQHLGNLSPGELASDEVLTSVRAADEAGPILRKFALEADRQTKGRRWSFCRDFGRTRLVGVDCRAGRVLEEGNRLMLDDEEWEWLCDKAEGDYDHLLLAMSDPYLLAPSLHDLQAWNEAVCGGVWGGWAAKLGERMREALDLDHWASFLRGFTRLTNLLTEVAQGKRANGRAPATIVALSGDVHNAYLAQVGFRAGTNAESRVYQAVCSPLRNPLEPSERHAQEFAMTGLARLIGRTLRAAGGVRPPDIRWRIERGPSFDNQIATLEIDGRKADLRVERPVAVNGAPPRLEPVFEHALSDG